MDNGKQSVCFSTTGKNESVCNMCFDSSREWLLIATQYRCMEYQVLSDTLHLILQPADNERIANANYTGSYIEIAGVEDWINSSNYVESRCEFYQRKRIKDEIYYSFSWGYVLPELTDDLFPECYKIENTKRISLVAPPAALDFIFYKHERAVSKYQNDENGFSYVYLSDDARF